MITHGIGINPKLPPPIVLKESERFGIGLASVRRNLRLSAMLNEPSVPTNAGTFRYAIQNPLKTPNTSPTSRPIRIATIAGYPLTDCAKYAEYIPAHPMIAPTERSIPPVNTTKVIPIASRPLIDALRKTFRRLAGLMKRGLNTVMIMIRRINPINEP